jgi:hypothetical protein
MNEHEYDRIYNEGGEGYNPIRAQREKEELEAAQKEAKKYALTPQGRIDALHRRIELECGSVAREWGDNAKIDDLEASLYAEINKIRAEVDADFLATWTLETTQARRKEWNTFVNAELCGGPMTPEKYRKMHNKTTQLGWGMEDLKRAVKLHGI